MPSYAPTTLAGRVMHSTATVLRMRVYDIFVDVEATPADNPSAHDRAFFP